MTTDTLVHCRSELGHGDLEQDALRNTKPVEADERVIGLVQQIVMLTYWTAIFFMMSLVPILRRYNFIKIHYIILQLNLAFYPLGDGKMSVSFRAE